MSLEKPKKSSKLGLDYFEQRPITVAKGLLGRVLVRERIGKSPIYSEIKEVAAYEGSTDSMSEGAKYSPGSVSISTKFGKNLIDISTLAENRSSCVTLIAGNLFDARGYRETAKGPGNLSKALEIGTELDNTPLNSSYLWIGGNPIDPKNIIKRKKTKVSKNCKGFYYFR
jgi:3-methyladenine DNA glycosylase Mpg